MTVAESEVDGATEASEQPVRVELPSGMAPEPPALLVCSLEELAPPGPVPGLMPPEPAALLALLGLVLPVLPLALPVPPAPPAPVAVVLPRVALAL